MFNQTTAKDYSVAYASLPAALQVDLPANEKEKCLAIKYGTKLFISRFQEPEEH